MRGRGLARRRRRGLAAALLMVTLAGCHTMRFEVAPGAAGPQVEERKSFFLWGLVPTMRVDMGARCPYGVARLTEDTTVVDRVFEILTLGIWAPRSTTYQCRDAPLEG